MMLATIIYLCYIALMSILTFALYGFDKLKAIKNKTRIRESTLFSFSLFGGALGALFGMGLFHHKTLHRSFWIINLLGLVIQVTIFVLIFYFELSSILMK